MTATRKPKAPTRRDRTFHHQRPEFVERSFVRHLAAGIIIEDDIALVREWIDEISANRQLSISRENKIAFNMVTWRRFIGPFRTNTIKDRPCSGSPQNTFAEPTAEESIDTFSFTDTYGMAH